MRTFIVILIVALAAGVAVQTLRCSRLADHNHQLQQQVAELRSRVAAAPDTTTAAPANTLSDEERTELLRLRNQAAQLRAATNELQQMGRQFDQMRAENQDLRSRPAGPSNVGTAAAAPSTAAHPRESWQFSGYATPEAALQSTLFAISKADYNSIMTSLTPEEAQRMQKEMDAANKSPEEVAEKLRREVAKATSYQVLETKETSPTEATLLIYASGEEKVQRVLLQKIGADWKF